MHHPHKVNIPKDESLVDNLLTIDNMALQRFGKEEQNRLFNLFLEDESLFAEVCDELEVILPSDDRLVKRTSFVENWVDAKKIINKLFESEHPDKKVRYVLRNLFDDNSTFINIDRGYPITEKKPSVIKLSEYESWYESMSVIKCIVAIVYCQYKLTNDIVWDSVLTAIIDALESLEYSIEGTYLDDLKKVIDKGIAEHRITNEFKYLQESNLKGEDDYLMNNLDQKVIISIMLKLLDSSGINLKKRGNKTKCAILIEKCTNIPLQTCKNVISDQNIPREHHREEIEKINQLLKDLEITWQI